MQLLLRRGDHRGGRDKRLGLYRSVVERRQVDRAGEGHQRLQHARAEQIRLGSAPTMYSYGGRVSHLIT